MLPPKFNKFGRPNIARDNLLQKIREVVTVIRLSRAIISRKMIFLSVSEPLKLMIQTLCVNFVLYCIVFICHLL